MIQEELWIERLANDAHIAYASSEKLWKAFANQLELRLSDEKAIDLGDAGVWYLKLEPEYLAQARGGEGYILVPPCLRLSIALKPHDNRAVVPLLGLSEGLSLASGIRLERSKQWLEVLIPALSQLLEIGKPAYWRYIGVLYPIEGVKGSYRLDLSSAFASGLNKPFAAFTPTPLASIDGHPDLEVRSLPSALSWGEAYSVAFVPSAIEGGARNTELQEPSEASAPHTETPLIVKKIPLEATEPSEETPSRPEETQADETELVTGNAPSTEPFQEDLITISEAEADTSKLEENPLKPIVVAEPNTTDREESNTSEQSTTLVSTSKNAVNEKYNNLHWRKRIAILLSLILLAILYTIYLMRQKSPEQAPAPQKELVLKSKPLVDSVPQARTADSISRQTEFIKQTRDSEEQPKVHQAEAKDKDGSTTSQDKADQPDTSWFDTSTETITIQEGDKLADIALRKYGHRAFWVYIYEENRELLPDPHRPTVGQKLTLPASKKYGINPNNTKSVSRALILQKSLSQ